MNNKTLSQQLCELCGIRPKCINCGQTVSNENPCKMPCDKQKYIDFENPENFVQLLELKYEKSNTIFSYVISRYNKIFNRQDFLWLLINVLNNEIKQSIHNYVGWTWR